MSIPFSAGLPMVMAPVNMPVSGPDVGYSAVTGGYNSGAGLAPLADPYAGQGVGIYNDASMYRGGDFWGGGSDPFAGTIYAGGGGGGGSITGSPLPDWSQNPFSPMDYGATPYDGYGSSWEYLDGGSRINRMTGEQQNGTVSHIEYGYDGSPTTVYSWGMNDMGQQPNYGTPEPQPQAPPSYPTNAGPSWWGGNSYPDIQGTAPPAADPGPASSPYWQGAGWNPWFDAKDQSQMPSSPYQPAAPDWSSMPSWLYGAGRGYQSPNPWITEGGGVGSDAGATRGRIAEMIASRGGGSVGQPIYPPTPFGGGFGFNAPTYTGGANISGQGPSWNIPGAFPPVDNNYDPSGALNNIWMVPQGGG